MRFKIKPTIYFRCDSGPKYGLGHLMRCVSLAQGFNKAGVDKIVFLIRKPEINELYNDLLEKNGFCYVFLPNRAKGLQFDFERYSHSDDFNIMIFDNYDVTSEQMVLYKKKYKNLIAIDDLADRYFIADFIINQNINAECLVYKTLGPAKLLLGTSYVLLRSNILMIKNRVKNKKESKIPHIFMNFGGGDIYSRIKNLLMMLHKLDQKLESKINIDFALTNNANQINKIRQRTSGFKKIKTNIIIDRYDLGPVIKNADFAVTSGGTSVFEIAYLGVPQMVFMIDKNQEVTGRKINEKGFGVCLGYIWDVSEVEFVKLFLDFLKNKTMRENMSRKGHEFIDGNGAERVAGQIMNYYGLVA